MAKLIHIREMGKFEVFSDAVEGAYREKLGEASEEWVAERIIKMKQEVDKTNYLYNMFERLSDKLVKDVIMLLMKDLKNLIVSRYTNN